MSSIKNRYDYFEEGNCEDPLDKEKYLDPLSCVYENSKIKFNKAPQFDHTPKVMIEKYWKYYYDKYGTENYQDLLLSINAIPYLGMLTSESTIAFPTLEDLENNFVRGKLNL